MFSSVWAVYDQSFFESDVSHRLLLLLQNNLKTMAVGHPNIMFSIKTIINFGFVLVMPKISSVGLT